MSTVAAVSSPYKGLAPFADSELDALLFFGREREREVIVANLLASRLTVLYGPSGVGKSSILRAGVVRRLRQEAPEAEVLVLDEWAGDAALPDPAAEAFLILDQFEEFFLYNPDGAPLLESLPELLARSDLHILIALREDALARLDVFQARLPYVFDNHLRLDHLDATAARAAILGPLARYNELAPADDHVEIQPALVDTVLEQVAAAELDPVPANGGARRIEAPYLQLVLERVWDEERKAGSLQLRLSTLERLGGAHTIVQEHLQRALGALPPQEAAIATNALKFLVTSSRTKIAHSVSDLVGYTDESPVDLRTVLESLASQRIVRAVAAEGEEGRYEIFHDVLAEPVLAWRREFEAQAALNRARAAAERRNRRLLGLAVGALIAAGALAALTVWAFTQRSHARHQTDVARQQRLLSQQHARATAHALKLVAVQAGIAKRQRGEALRERNIARSARREALRQRNIARDQGLQAQVAAQNALTARQQALHAARIARSARARATGEAALAKHRQREAIAQEQNATRQRARAEASATRAKARELAALALTLINVHPVAAVRRALEAAALERSDRAEGVLRQAVVADRLRRILPAGGAVQAASFSPVAPLVLTVGPGGARLFASDGTLVRRLGDGPVDAARFSPDGSQVATAGPRGVQIWSGRDWKAVRTLTTDPAQTLGFSADGTRVAAATRNEALVWSADGTLLATLPHDGAVSSVQLDGSGDRAVTVAIDSAGHLQARVFAVAGSGSLQQLLPERGITSATFSPDGQLIATTSNDKTARLWEVGSGTEVARMTSDGHLLAAGFSRDGKLLVTTNEAGGAAVWDVPTGALRVQMVGPTNKVESAAFSPDARFVVISSLDRTARVYRTSDGLQIALLAGHADGVHDAEFSPDSRRVVTASADGTARIWDPGVGDLLAPVLRHDGPAYVAHFSPDSKHIVSAGADSTARLWPGGIVLAHKGPVHAAVFSPDSKLVLTGSDDGTSALWRVSDGRRLLSLALGAPVEAVAFSPDGSTAATADKNGAVTLWRVSDGHRRQVLAGARGPVDVLAFAPGGTLLAAGGADGVTRVWTVATGAARLTLPGGGGVTALAFSPDGSRLAAGSADGNARLWSIPDGRRLAVLSGHTAALTDVEYSRAGDRIVTSSVDSDAQTWDGYTGKPLHVLAGHFGPVQAASFSPDGRWIVTAGPFTAGLWSSASGELFSPTGSSDPYLRGPKLRLTSASFSPDGNRILVSSEDGTARIYSCQICGGLSSLRRLGHTLLHDAAVRPTPSTP